MGGVGRVTEEMDVVLTTEANELEGVARLVSIGEEEHVMVRILAHRLDLSRKCVRDSEIMEGEELRTCSMK